MEYLFPEKPGLTPTELLDQKAMRSRVKEINRSIQGNWEELERDKEKDRAA